MNMTDRGLSDEQRMMRDSCRAFVDDFVIPFIRQNWQHMDATVDISKLKIVKAMFPHTAGAYAGTGG